MKNKPARKDFLSTISRRHPQGSKDEISSTVRWVGYSALSIFLTLTLSSYLAGNYRTVTVLLVGIVPIFLSLQLLRSDAVTSASTALAVSIILLITALATLSNGIYDIGTLGYPVILIVAGLILRGRVIKYLVLLTILCLGWLVFGDIWGWYEPVYIIRSLPEDFFIGSFIILVAGNAIYRLVKNIYNSIAQAEHEIASRKAIEKQREKLIQQLTAKNQELDRFALRVSHDLKTPLITLAGFLGYLGKDIEEGNTEKAEKDFAQINRAAKTMGKFVDELLDLSRVGRITNPPTDVLFGEIVHDALIAVDGPLKAKQIHVEVEADFPIVHVDRPRIEQVIQNLIVNAIKFMGGQPYPMINIGVENIEDELIFFVQDNGIGIGSEHHESIFELFNKLDPTTEGTGIGLGLVKRIIEVHKGRLWVESEPGKGATFKFTLQ